MSELYNTALQKRTAALADEKREKVNSLYEVFRTIRDQLQYKVDEYDGKSPIHSLKAKVPERLVPKNISQVEFINIMFDHKYKATYSYLDDCYYVEFLCA